MPPYIAEAALTDEELARFSRLAEARARSVPSRGAWQETALGLAVAFAGAMLALAAHVVEEEGGAFFVLLLLLAAYAAGLLAMRRAVLRHHRAVAAAQRATPDLPGRHRRYVFAADGFRTESDIGSSHWRWSAITGAEEAEGLILLWIGQIQGLAIPVRAFAGPGEARAALDLARRAIAAPS